MSASGSQKAIIAAFCANLGIAVAKFIGFLLTGASSMLSEAIHSVADTGNQGLLLLGRHRADQEGRRAAPLRVRTRAVLLGVRGRGGAVHAGLGVRESDEGIHKIQHPEELSSPAVAIGILGFAILLEGYSLRTAVVESNKLRGDHSWWGFIRHSKVPELPVVLLEDFGAITGLLIACLVAVSVSIVTGNGVYDGIGSVAIGLILGAIAVVLCIEMKSLLIGEPVSARDRAVYRQAMEGTPVLVRVPSTIAPSTSAPRTSCLPPRSSSRRDCRWPSWPTR